jgi:hypothetical protein
MRRWVGLLAVALGLTIVPTVSGVVSRVPHLVTYGAVIRYPSSGPWQNGHTTSGYSDIQCDPRTGNLLVFYERLASVTTAFITPDETLSRRGIVGGASVGTEHEVILFTRYTKDGPKPLSCTSSLLRGDVANFWIGLFGMAAS